MSLSKQKKRTDNNKKNDNGSPISFSILQPAYSFLKAELRIEHYSDKKLVVKDYSRYAGTLWSPLISYLMRREARILACLDGWPHAPRFLGYQGDYAFAMEYVEGHRINQVKKLKLDVNFSSLLKAVSELHRKGVFHNDLRSTNILVNTQGQLIFIDYGASIIIPDFKVFSPVRRVLRTLNLSRTMKLKRQLSERPLTETQRRLLLRRRWFKQARGCLKIIKGFVYHLSTSDASKSLHPDGFRLHYWHDKKS